MIRTRHIAALAILLAGSYLLASTLLGAEARKVKKSVQPQYPALALKMKVEGTVTLEASIDADGNVEEVKAVSGHTLLKDPAAECLKKWQYEPGTGKTVETVNVIFRLPN